MRNILITTICLLSIAAHADRMDGRDQKNNINDRAQIGAGDFRRDQVNNSDIAIRDLYQRIEFLNQRLNQVEEKLLRHDEGRRGPITPPRAPIDLNFVCMLTDSGYSKTFVASAKTMIDAEFNVRDKCSKEVHTSYCSSQAKLSCDNNLNSRGRGFICVVEDSGYKKRFRGEGLTQIEAEANAKISCQRSVHASYCGKVNAQCEEVF